MPRELKEEPHNEPFVVDAIAEPCAAPQMRQLLRCSERGDELMHWSGGQGSGKENAFTSFLLHCRVNTWLIELELEGLLLPDVVLGPLLHELIVLTLQLVQHLNMLI